MSLLGRSFCSIVSVVIVIMAAAPIAHARPTKSAHDQVEAYLTQAGLDELLVLHLERRLDNAQSRDRTRIAARLAETYARLLARTDDENRKQVIKSRSKELLRNVPDAQSLGLRLSLAQSAYASAESIAERWRMRLAAQAEKESALRVFTELQPELARIAENAHSRINYFERQEEAVGRSELITQALSDARRHRSVAHFLAGWCSAYIAELDASQAGGAASAGLRHFGALLDARPGAAPTISRVKRKQLRFEHIARSVLGVALCESLRGNVDDAMAWLDLLEDEQAIPASVRTQITARRLIVLARAKRWGQIASVVHRRTVEPSEQGDTAPGLSLTEARLLAVISLEASDGDRTGLAISMAQTALSELAVKGEVGQLLDLIDEYLATVRESDDELGFLPAYLRGLREYERARKSHKSAAQSLDHPTDDPAAARGYRAATRFFKLALTAKDADRFRRAIPGAMLLEALSHYYAAVGSEALADAAEALTGAAHALGRSDPNRAGGAYRLAILALDQAAQDDPKSSDRYTQRREALVEQFLDRHRAHPAAAAYLYQRATSGSRSVALSIEDLLSIAQTSYLASAAYHEAARLLYRIYIDAQGAQRLTRAAEFLEIAERLLARDRARILAGDVSVQQEASINARRILDCELSLPAANIPRVSLAHDLLVTLRDRGLLTDERALAELRYRAVQLALLRGRFDEAEAAALALAESDPTLTTSAHRLLFTSASARWRRLRDDSPNTSASIALVETARRAMSYGSSVIDALGPEQRSLNVESTASLFVTTAEIASFLWFAANDQMAAALAQDLYVKLRKFYPYNTDILTNAAKIYEAAGDVDAALDCYRNLLAGYEAGTSEWFGVKVRLLELLIESDPARAREVLEQHKLLYPDLAPEPYLKPMRRIDRDLQQAGEP